MTQFKKVKLKLVRNLPTFMLLTAFQTQAKKEGWSYGEIDLVLEAALAGDHDHLVRTLSNHCVDSGR
jgi:hypothetical protein